MIFICTMPARKKNGAKPIIKSAISQLKMKAMIIPVPILEQLCITVPSLEPVAYQIRQPLQQLQILSQLLILN